jgi:hypothetical protein
MFVWGVAVDANTLAAAGAAGCAAAPRAGAAMAPASRPDRPTATARFLMYPVLAPGIEVGKCLERVVVDYLP